MATDVPKLFNGAVNSAVFMFQRFRVKDYELGINLLRQKRMGALGRWIGMKVLIGGTKAITNPVIMATGAGYLTHKAYKELKDELGDGAANLIAYGLPSLIGLDMSYSMQWADIPRGENIAEEIGNTLLGPAGGDAIAYIKAYKDTKGIEQNEWKRVFNEAAHKNPALRWMEGLQQLSQGSEDGLYDFKTSSGKLRYRNDLRAVIINAMGGKVIGEKAVVNGKVVDLGPFDVWAQAMTDVAAKRDETIDRIAQKVVAGQDYEKEWLGWLELYPEVPITKSDVISRAKARYLSGELTQREQMLKRSPKAIRGEFSK